MVIRNSKERKNKGPTEVALTPKICTHTNVVGREENPAQPLATSES